ncbi:MAG: LysR family transcriptional regulator [Xanthobacteraceae bacterium]
MKSVIKRSDAVRLHAHWVLYFHEVVQARSIRGAAKALNVAPSAISRRLKEVEALVGGKLIERGSAGFRLTAAGEVVADHVSQVLRGLGRMQSSLDELRGLRRGHVTVAAVAPAAPAFVPKVVASMREAYPRVSVRCDFVGSRQVVESVREGRADVGICFNPPSSRALRSLISVPLPFGAVVSPDNTFASCRAIRIYDLVEADIPLIFPDDSASARALLESVIIESSLEVQPAVVSANREFAIALAKLGAGAAFQNTLGLERELREGSLAFLPLVDPKLEPQDLTIIMSALRPQSAAAMMMGEALRASAAKLLE